MKVELELGDDGVLNDDHLQKLPDVLKSYISSGSDKAFKEGYSKGMARKASELAPHLVDPVEREKQAAALAELEERRIKDAERDKQYEEARRLRDERHAKELEDKQREIVKREEKLRRAIAAEIKAAAVQAGARDESLPELAAILGGEIDLNEELEPFVKGADGKPAVDEKSQPLTIEGRVRAYLEAHRHHLRTNTGVSGGARGGASYAHLSTEGQDAARSLESVQKRIQDGDRSEGAIEALFQAQRKLRKAQAGA